MAQQFKFDTLNTSFVSLAALLRHLRQNNFVGRMHVVLDQYEADIFLYGADSPSVWESDHSAGRESQGEAAMQRLLVRSRQPGGVIALFEGPITATTTPVADVEAPVATPVEAPVEKSAEAPEEAPSIGSEPEKWLNETTEPNQPPDLADVIAASAEVIAAVERAIDGPAIKFDELFYLARVEIGDDYPFLDPTVGGFEYAQGKVNLDARPAPGTFAQGVSESLKRVVNRVAPGKEETSFRERVAVELALAAGKLPNGLGPFMNQLDKIAGTRVV
ncbi:MAG TPA: hypothetical protein VI306_19900 [Pyrinomonadaceae bacterium]